MKSLTKYFMDAFYQAFNIQEGDPMYIESDNRVRIW